MADDTQNTEQTATDTKAAAAPAPAPAPQKQAAAPAPAKQDAPKQAAQSQEAQKAADKAADDAAAEQAAAEKKAAEEAQAAADQKAADEAAAAEQAAKDAAAAQEAADAAATAAAPATIGSTIEVPADEPAIDYDAQHLTMIRAKLDQYVSLMGAAIPVDPKAGAQHQLKLYRTITEVLGMEGNKFNRAWSEILSTANAQRDGAFAEIRVFRFFDGLKLENSEKRVFQNLLHLIIHTADPKGRASMIKNNLDMASVTKDIPVPNAADKLYGYYAA